jgi:predicted  nucleic acid-binding Zn-ribbon protein
MIKRCAVCGKFQKKETEMVMVEGKSMCPVCYAKYLAEHKDSVPEVEKGAYGVTNHQMIPFINANIDNKEAIVKAAAMYEDTFKNSVRYLRKPIRMKVAEYLQNLDEVDEDKMRLVNYLKPSRKGITRHQVIPAINEAVESKNYVMLIGIKKYFPQVFVDSLVYVKKANREIAMKVTSTEVINKAMASK